MPGVCADSWGTAAPSGGEALSYSQAKCVSKYIFTCSVCGVVREEAEKLTRGQDIRPAELPEGWTDIWGYPICGSHMVVGDLIIDGVPGFFTYPEGKWQPYSNTGLIANILRDALMTLREGVDRLDAHCNPVPEGSSWRFVIDKALDEAMKASETQ